MSVTPLLWLSLSLIPLSAALSYAFGEGMKRASFNQQIRPYGPTLHAMKSGTPTMGGVVILLLWGASLSLLHWIQGLSTQSVFILSAGVTCGFIGLMDDLFAQRRRRSLGFSPLQKVLLVTLASVLLFLVFPPEIWNVPLNIPFSSLTLLPPSTFLGFLLFWFVFTAMTNSMNLTDGLDGLAAGTTLLILIGFLVLSPQVALPSLVPLVGILIGFLWVNSYPAQLFLGDVGSFALGGVVAATALSSGLILILPFLAGLLVLETGSVILQVLYYRLTGRRIFKMSPFHHHFEQTGEIDSPYLLPKIEWPEPKITLRLLILQALFIGLGILAVRL